METLDRHSSEKRSVADSDHKKNAQRVVFGAGSIRKLRVEIEALGITRVLILCTSNLRALAELVKVTIGSEQVAGIFDQPTTNISTENVREACSLAKKCVANGVVAIGGRRSY